SASIVTLLLVHQANPDALQHGGFTALMAAAMQGNLAMVETLLNHGANPKLVALAPPHEGHTALDMATEGGHDSLVKRLGD
ncbi:MAG: ankyrin repeat domain-containing protein, partial [Planctomycetota bacterium]|nr:ankyrin repeat domain-containing protein [Planctomycetota bacterium]